MERAAPLKGGLKCGSWETERLGSSLGELFFRSRVKLHTMEEGARWTQSL